ncbi:MAG: hypothetical protein ACTTKI_06270 [Tannerella sp.]|uniref:Cbp1 family collagen-binding glycoprotein adhesin n=1 Tax=Tannerella sp. TaxID=2382127 RepID=UPI003FA24318
MKKVILFIISAMIWTSCVENSAEYKKLKSENEMLKAEKAQSTTELNEMLSTLNDIQTDIQAIREAENYLAIEQSDGELNPNKKEQIKQNMRLIAETLKNNKTQLSELQEKLKKSNIQSSALQKTIDRLSSELNQKATMIAALQEDLAKKDIRIQELDELVTSLNENVENLSVTTAAQSQKITEQDQQLHRAYYCFGTKKELKEQQILTGGGLFSKSKALQGNFNEDYFIPIDTREVTSIQLYARKATVRSNHPDRSYKLDKDGDGNLVLNILDPKVFWSLSKHLVVEVG